MQYDIYSLSYLSSPYIVKSYISLSHCITLGAHVQLVTHQTPKTFINTGFPRNVFMSYDCDLLSVFLVVQSCIWQH